MKIELPKDWNSVTIGQFQNLAKIKEQMPDAENEEYIIEMISILSGIERQKLYEISFVDIARIWSVLVWVTELNFSEQIVPEFTIGETTYVANLDVRQMTAGQLIDLKHYMKDGNSVDNMHNILAIFYIPKGKKYNEVNIEDVASTFQSELSISIAYPLQVFFCARSAKWKSLTRGYTKESLTSRSRRGLKKLLPKRKHSMSDGAGL